MGPSRQPEKAVLISSSDKDYGDDVLLIVTSAIPKEHFHWVPTDFSKVALSEHFGQVRDSPTPFFFTKGQYMLYRGDIDVRSMRAEH